MNISFSLALDMKVHVMHDADMKTLQQYMKETGTKDADLAVIAGVDRSMIARIRLGKATPSLKVALAIKEATGVDVETMLAKPAATEAAE